MERSLYVGLGSGVFDRGVMELILEFFKPWEPQPRCVFCGSTDVKRWDHLIPAIDGGETVCGNIVPACSPCDDSKGRRPFEEWMTSTAKKSPTARGVCDVEARVVRIKAYVSEFGYVCSPVRDRLTPDEASRLDDLLKRLRRLRVDAYQLIEDYKGRVENTEQRSG